MYLSAFYFPGEEAETDFMFALKTTYDQSVYPYRILPKVGLDEIIFRPVTILYGGNGSGKSTALNIIAEKLRLTRNSVYNRSRFFEDFVDKCKVTLEEPVPGTSRIITSDDVFDMMLDIRSINANGFLDTTGQWHTLDNPEDYKQILHQLELVEYQNFGSKV